MKKQHATARFHDSENHEMRYVHRYYLPRDLGNKITPNDINGIISCFPGYAEYKALEKRVPEKLPGCVIHYRGMDMKRCIKRKTVRRVLDAYSTYIQDCWAVLTPEETQAALNLNEWLIDWEKQLLANCIQLSEDMELRVRSGDPWLTYYDASVTVWFFVRSDDPFYDMPDSLGDGYGDYCILCEPFTICHLPVSASQAVKDEYRGIGDGEDYNVLREQGDNPIYHVRHCKTFHKLYNDMHIPMKDMGRVGRVVSRISIDQNNEINIDLTGERAIAVRDEPRIIEDFDYIIEGSLK